MASMIEYIGIGTLPNFKLDMFFSWNESAHAWSEENTKKSRSPMKGSQENQSVVIAFEILSKQTTKEINFLWSSESLMCTFQIP